LTLETKRVTGLNPKLEKKKKKKGPGKDCFTISKMELSKSKVVFAGERK